MRVKKLKVLYGLLKNVLTFFFKVVNYLEYLGFKLNTYDGCIEKISINIKNQPVIQHTYDFRVCAKVVTQLQKIYDSKAVKHK